MAGIVAAVGGYMTGEMSIGIAIQTGIGSLVAIFMRDSVAKLVPNSTTLTATIDEAIEQVKDATRRNS